MWPDRVSNPGPLTYESGALLTALRSPACKLDINNLVAKTDIILMMHILIKSKQY